MRCCIERLSTVTMMNAFRTVVFIQTFLLTLCSGDYQEPKKPPHPHIIFVTLRDMVS